MGFVFEKILLAADRRDMSRPEAIHMRLLQHIGPSSNAMGCQAKDAVHLAAINQSFSIGSYFQGLP